LNSLFAAGYGDEAGYFAALPEALSPPCCVQGYLAHKKRGYLARKKRGAAGYGDEAEYFAALPEALSAPCCVGLRA